jgi:hypothetical protein
MKTKLEELTVAELVTLMCGDSSVLLSKHEFAQETKIVEATKAILLEFKQLSDPAGFAAYISQNNKYVKAKMTHVLFTVCHNLIVMKKYDEVRQILSSYLPQVRKMNDKRLATEVESRLGKANAELAKRKKEVEDVDVTPETIRNNFDEQTAALMAYYKFQIDTSTLKATIYAHLMARYHKEMKAKISAMKK